MRIIAGSARGRRLDPPTWEGLRPTSDKLRETLFNVIAARVPEARVLDLFAGTGAIGLEALSRGAAHATFVESEPRAVALIVHNAERCGLASRCVIIRDTAERALHHRMNDALFDVVVLDPPYDFQPLDAVLSSAARRLAPEGLLILEHAFRRSPPVVESTRLARTVRSGDSALTLFEAV